MEAKTLIVHERKDLLDFRVSDFRSLVRTLESFDGAKIHMNESFNLQLVTYKDGRQELELNIDRD